MSFPRLALLTFCYLAHSAQATACSASDDTAITTDCQCASFSNTNECVAGNFCYDGTCNYFERCNGACTTDSDCSWYQADAKCTLQGNGCMGCTWTPGEICNENIGDSWYSKILTGSILGAIFGMVAITLVSLPVCCGVLMPKAKLLAGISIILAILVMVTPAIAGSASTDAAINEVCEKCTCDDAEKDKYRDDLAALGIIVAYTLGFGFLCVIIGIVALILSCCAICPCCGPLKTAAASGGGGGGNAPPVAIGQPV